MTAISLTDIGSWAWILWLISGVVCGIVSSLVFAGRRSLWIDVCVGIVSALAGAVSCALLIGVSTAYDTILTVMCGVLSAGVVLWLMDEIVYNTPDDL